MADWFRRKLVRIQPDIRNWYSKLLAYLYIKLGIRMGTFLLVHGACHGGWCWRKVNRILRDEGHDVFSPTLTGLGERAHLITPATNLNTHIEDINNVMFYEDLDQVVLVGHSYAGMVITGATNNMPERVRHLVYLDADTPEDGQSLSDLYPKRMKEIIDTAKQRGDDLLIPPIGENPYGVSDHIDLEWFVPRLVPHPIGNGALTTKVSFSNSIAREIPKTFIKCTMDLDQEAQRDYEKRGFVYKELRTGHDAMITAAQEVADILLEFT